MNKNNNRDEPAGIENPGKISRRNLLKHVGLAGAAVIGTSGGSLMSVANSAPSAPQFIPLLEAYETLTATESQILDALVSRILPSDVNGPGAHEARAVHYIDRALAGFASNLRESYRTGLQAVDDYTNARKSTSFHMLSSVEQDAILTAMAKNDIEGFPGLDSSFFAMLRGHTIEGTFSDPYYGGNRDFIGWDLLGYPGVRALSTPEDTRLGRALEPSRQSAYNMPPHVKNAAGSHSYKSGGASDGH